MRKFTATIIIALSLAFLLFYNFIAYFDGSVPAGNMLWNHSYAKSIVTEMINDNMSEYEKATVLAEYVCKNITYSLEEGSHYQIPKIKHSLENHAGVCYDYASTYVALCREAGLRCLYFGGTNNGEYHSWNKVFADGVWYFVDNTQDSYYENIGQNALKAGLVPTSNREEVPEWFHFQITERS